MKMIKDLSLLLMKSSLLFLVGLTNYFTLKHACLDFTIDYFLVNLTALSLIIELDHSMIGDQIRAFFLPSLMNFIVFFPLPLFKF